MRRILFYALMPLVLIILLVEVPMQEIGRAWRNMHIWRNYKSQFRLFVREFKKGP
jgi:C4-dicarboxylate transporter